LVQIIKKFVVLFPSQNILKKFVNLKEIKTVSGFNPTQILFISAISQLDTQIFIIQ